MPSAQRALLVASVLLLVSVAAAQTVQPSGYLQDYRRLGHVGGVPVEQVWIEPHFDIRNYRNIYVAPVQIDPYAYRRHGQQDADAARRLAQAFRASLVEQLQASGIFAVVSTDPYWSTPRHQTLILYTRITEMNSGNPRARKWIGLGAGATEVQIEGKIIETREKRTLCEFADRRFHPGNVWLWGHCTAEHSEYLIGIDMKQILSGVVKLFIYMREEGPEADQRYGI